MQIKPPALAGSIQPGSVSGGPGGSIAQQTITNYNIANQTITATQIANQTITNTQIANNTITFNQIATQTIQGGGGGGGPASSNISPNTISSADTTGYTGTALYVNSLSCSGGTVTYTTKTLTFTNGLCQSNV